jgi:hypothetical protein
MSAKHLLMLLLALPITISLTYGSTSVTVTDKSARAVSGTGLVFR